MHVATFNVFWLGFPDPARILRGAREEEDLVHVLRVLDADVLVFQEIVNLPLLDGLLRRAGRSYRVKDVTGRWVTSGPMRSRVSRSQKLALAWDDATVELVRWFLPIPRNAYPGPRAPLAAELRA